MAQYILINTVNMPAGPVYAGSVLDDRYDATLIANIPGAGGKLTLLPNAELEAAGVKARAAKAAGHAEMCDDLMLAALATQGKNVPPLRIVYDATTTFEKADYVAQGYTAWDAEVVSGGGGGGSGRRGATLTDRYGGNGGAGGSKSRGRGLLVDLPDSVNVTVNIGGPGGAAQTVNDTDGIAGEQGGSASFYYGSPYAVVAFGGAGGAGGTATPSTTAQALPGAGDISGSPGGTTSGPDAFYGGEISYPYTSAEVAPGTVIDFNSYKQRPFAAGGGGAGGGVDATDAVEGSGAIGAPAASGFQDGTFAQGGTNGGGGDGGAGGNGQAVGANFAQGGGGGAGGGGSKLGSGGAGGVGGLCGGGGGGGGNGTNGVGDSGGGGDGGHARVVLVLT